MYWQHFLQQVASPKVCYQWAARLQPWIGVLCLIAFIDGLIGGLLIAPPDYQQGDAYRIIFVHVPAAMGSLGIYLVMTWSVIVFLVWKIKVADMVAKVSAPIGASFTLVALVTGAIWGKPTWGTWWIWDARLTSELLLLFIYSGIMALRSAIPDRQMGARACGIMTLVGVVNIPIIHYSVLWWQTLHQGVTLFRWGGPSIVPAMLYPLLAMMLAFLCYYIFLLLWGLRCELLQREQATQWVQLIAKKLSISESE